MARAAILRKSGNLARAQEALREIESRAGAQWVPGHPGYPVLLSERAELARAHGDLETALQLVDRAVNIVAARPDRAVLPRMLVRRAMVALDAGRAEVARADAERALQIFQEVSGPGGRSSLIGRSALALGRALMALGRRDDARQALTTANESFVQVLGTNHPDTKTAQQLLSKVDALAHASNH
jgi:tetratricopeptide (TPR) repeat protein